MGDEDVEELAADALHVGAEPFSAVLCKKKLVKYDRVNISLFPLTIENVRRRQLQLDGQLVSANGTPAGARVTPRLQLPISRLQNLLRKVLLQRKGELVLDQRRERPAVLV